MAKFYGQIGYIQNVEDEENPGVWEEQAIEKPYYGDITRNMSHYQQNSNL